ncbi:PAS domain S-box protein [Pedobacter boryungensis]|uniref:histidine kinase n=1 Tax=Pedobacter boryungensis TaxID=869962 RepID=A0ABX2DGA3_9SPHI|nr:PAS domain S-box protein [Pedobacter boryungensis]NQX33138.1 PAS domain S-box protein [Pedobacter boryungensis]
MKETAELSVEQLNYILSLTKTATAVHVGEDATIKFANKAMLNIWGKDNQVIGKTLAQALPELEGQPFIEMFARVWREGITISGSDTAADLMINGETKTFYFDFEYRAVKDSNNNVIAILHTATDVTERYLNRRELKEAVQNRELLQREQSLNEELASSNEELNAINEELSKSREDLFVMNRDLEQRVEERVKAFAESEERFRSMAENTDILIAVGNETGKKFYFNKAWTKLTGRTSKQLIDSGWEDLMDERDSEEYKSVQLGAYQKRVSYSNEFRLRGVDGKVHWMLKKGTPRFLSDGTFAGYISSCVDITQRKEDEQLLQDLNEELATSNEELAAVNEELAATNEELEKSFNELVISERRFRTLIRQAPVAICVIRAQDLMITDVNDAYLELVGKERIELEDHTIWDAVAEAAEGYAPVLQNVIDTGIPFHAREHEVTLIRKGVPERIFIDFVYEPLRGLSGEIISVMVVGNDVTDKVIARHSIEDSEERNRLAVEAAEIGTYDYSYETDTLTTGGRFNLIFGVANGVRREEIIQMYHPDDVDLSPAAHEAAKNDGKLFYETRFQKADGSLRWARFHGKIYYHNNGQPKRILGTVLDITAYKKLQQQKDDFISIASHELKTPITSLKASLQLLQRMKDNSSPHFPKLIEQSARSMNKISELVEDLLNVTRMQEGLVQLNKENFTIAQMLDDCCTHVRQLGTYELIVEGDRNLQVIADEHRLEQVVVNFVNNAIKYAPNENKIFLTVEDLGDTAKVSVRDTGPGIAKEKLPHLFERYFRADPSGAQVSGLGLGLYISADIIERHKGKIGVDSEEGKGSTFWFIIPKA